MGAISIGLLVDSAEVRPVVGINADRKPTYGDTIYLERVRIWSKAIVTVTDKGYQRADTSLLIYDVLNSKAYKIVTEEVDGEEISEKRYISFVPAKGMKVKYNGTEYEVRGVTPCKRRVTKAVHHYELDLV